MTRLLLVSVALFCIPSFAEIVDRTAAIVGKELILQSDIEELLKQPGIGLKSSDDALRILIEKALFETDCKAAGQYPTATEIKQTITDVKRQNRLDDKGFENALRSMGTTYEAYEKQLHFEICKQKIVQNKIRGRVNISKEDVKKAYERQFGSGAEVQLRLRDMVVQPKSTKANDVGDAKRIADSIVEKLRKGNKWDQVLAEAKKAGQKVTSENLGVISRSDLVPSIADSVFSNSDEKFRGPIETDEGFHVLELLEKVEGAKIPLVDVEKDLHKQLFEKEVERLLKQYVEELRASTYVDILEVS